MKEMVINGTRVEINGSDAFRSRELSQLIKMDEDYYGEVRLTFRRGQVTKITFEQTHVFDAGRNPSHHEHNR